VGGRFVDVVGVLEQATIKTAVTNTQTELTVRFTWTFFLKLSILLLGCLYSVQSSPKKISNPNLQTRIILRETTMKAASSV
jgi:hypothetical protein